MQKRAARVLLISAFCILHSAFFAYAKNGAFASTKHGDRVKGPQRRLDRPAGSCIQCHDQHASHTPGAAQNNNAALFTANDNNFCFVCHANRSDDGAYPGNAAWWQSTHGTSPSVYRGGSAPRPPADASLCVNCHDPHGVKDGQGVIRSLLAAREPELCMTCHDGSRTRDLTTELAKPFRHPFGARPNAHDPAAESEGRRSAALAANNRHADCSDCHDVHAAKADRRPPIAPVASQRLAGVSRVEVVNGAAGTAPRFVWRSGADSAEGNEYEICFKCHSSWAQQPPGQPDLALQTNPANPSYHPIQALGKNRIDPSAFVNNMSSESQIFCSDCHGSDDPTLRGPHASQYRFLLKKPSSSSGLQQGMTADDICFSCHAYAAYGDASAPDAAQRASRFNAPSDAGHVFHVGAQKLACYACHDTHGSTRFGALIARRAPGITSFTQTSSGGTCTTTCHAPKSYRLNYPR